MRASGGKTAGATATSCCAPARLRHRHDTVRYRGTWAAGCSANARRTNCTCSSPPVVHGHGKRLLAEPGDKVPLKLGDPAAFQTGVLTLTYARA